jgi:hypothetical protein
MSYLPKVSLKISRLDKVLDGMANNKKKEKEKEKGVPAAAAATLATASAMAAADAAAPTPSVLEVRGGSRSPGGRT